MQLSRQLELLFIEEKSRSTQLEQKITEQEINLKGEFQKSIFANEANESCMDASVVNLAIWC